MSRKLLPMMLFPAGCWLLVAAGCRHVDIHCGAGLGFCFLFFCA